MQTLGWNGINNSFYFSVFTLTLNRYFSAGQTFALNPTSVVPILQIIAANVQNISNSIGPRVQILAILYYNVPKKLTTFDFRGGEKNRSVSIKKNLWVLNY